MVRKGGLEPPHLSVPDPKSGASANSATFARASNHILKGAKKNITRECVSHRGPIADESRARTFKATRVRSARGQEGGLASAALSDAVGCFRQPEEVLANLFSNKPGAFQFKVSALNLALIN